ncbi:unnamed protein product [Ixodes pacificus]
MPEFVTSSQDVIVPGREALCLTLRRLAYPNRWCDLEPVFGRHASVMSSVTSQVLQNISQTFGHLLTNCNNHEWLTPARMLEFASAVHNKGGPLPNCWGFIDGTARPICRPKRNQKAYFSGHKRMHVVKYQSIMCPNGIVCQLDGPYPGRRHDAGILRDSGLYSKLERLVGNQDLVIYGDPAYPLKPLLSVRRFFAGAYPTGLQLWDEPCPPSRGVGVWQSNCRVCFLGLQKKSEASPAASGANV